MKKLLKLILAVVMFMGILPTTLVYATAPDNNERILEYSKNYTANERTDEYALNYFSFSPYEDWASRYPEQYKVMKKITEGITSDYEKVVAIAEWVNENMTYDTTNDADGSLAAAGIPKWLRGACGEYADTAMVLLRLAGFPVKRIEGRMSGELHAWNHVFIEGRWYFLDTTNWDYNTGSLMIPADFYSEAYYITSAPHVNWDGTLTIVDANSFDIVRTIGPLPVYSTIADIPEIASETLYTDATCTKPVDPKTWKFDARNRALFTKLPAKSHRVSFNVQLDNQYKSIVPHVVDETDDNLNSFVTVPSGSDFPQVKLPVKPGYTFIGWQELYEDNGPLWNAGSGKVTKDMTMIAVFQKGTVNTNRPVTSNANNANPTTSKVLANGKAVQFEAYNIGGNNYFKLRDLAQAVNSTEKNFEVTWDGKNNAINLISNKPYTPVGGELAKGDGKAKVANHTTSKIYKDGKEISLTAYNIDGNNYFKLRDIAKAFNIGVFWDGKTNTVIIDTSKDYAEE